LRARLEQTQLEDLSDASILGKLLVLPANVRLDWKVIARYKHSSLFGNVISNKEKKFYNIDTWSLDTSSSYLEWRLGLPEIEIKTIRPIDDNAQEEYNCCISTLKCPVLLRSNKLFYLLKSTIYIWSLNLLISHLLVNASLNRIRSKTI
jgi:hypothetical protein